MYIGQTCETTILDRFMEALTLEWLSDIASFQNIELLSDIASFQSIDWLSDIASFQSTILTNNFDLSEISS